MAVASCRGHRLQMAIRRLAVSKQSLVASRNAWGESKTLIHYIVGNEVLGRSNMASW